MLIDSLKSTTDGHIETSKVTRGYENGRFNSLSDTTNKEYSTISPPFYKKSTAIKDTVFGSGELDKRIISKTTNESCGW